MFDPSCIDVADYLDCLDLRNITRATEKEFRFSCPYPAHTTGDETPSAYMNAESTAFFCHSCHAKGNAITLAAEVLRCSQLEATRLLRQRYQPGGINPDARNMTEEISKILNKKPPIKRENVILPESTLDRYKVIWDTDDPWAVYMRDRGFSVATLYAWQFGYSHNSKRITLPIRDENGRLVGIKARAMDDRKPKYLNLREGEIEPYLKNEIVFGLHLCIFQRHLIVVEGEFNAVAMHQHGYTNTVAINGSYFGERQMKLLREHAERVTLFFDSDRAGNDATWAVAKALEPFIDVEVCPEHEGDPADMHIGSIARCLEGAIPYRQVLLLRS